MRSMSMLQLIGGIAAAGVVAAGSTALTANGLTNSAGASQFIGGTVTQTVTGAGLSSITYAFADPAKTQITGVTFVFTDAVGKAFTMTPTGGAFTTATKWYCGATTTSTGHIATLGSNTVTCETADNADADAGYWSGLTSMAVQIA